MKRACVWVVLLLSVLSVRSASAQAPASGESIQAFSTNAGVVTMALTDDGRFLVLAHERENQLTVWDVRTGRMVKTVACDSPRSILCRQGRLFVANYGKGTISVFGPEPEWKLTDQLLVGESDVYYLSAPKGAAFDGKILASCGGYGKHRVSLVDSRNDSSKSVLQETYMSVATVDALGKNVILQGELTHSPAGVIEVLDYAALVAGRRESRGRGQHGATPIVQQVGSGSVWCGEGRTLIGMPPMPEGERRGRWAIPDLAGDMLYFLETNQVEACRADMALTSVSRRPVDVPLPSRKGASPRPKPRGAQTKEYRVDQTQAVRFGPHVVCFFREGDTIYRGLFKGLVDTAPHPQSGGQATGGDGGSLNDSLAMLPTESAVTTLTLTEDGRFLVLAHENENRLSIWDARSGRSIKLLACESPRYLLSRGERLFVANHGKGTISVFGPAPEWKLVNQLVVGQTDVYYLSAPAGAAFDGKILATGGTSGKHKVCLVDSRKDSNKTVLQEVYMSVATVDAAGRKVILQGELSHSPSAVVEVLDYPALIGGRRESVGRGEHTGTPIIRQVGSGPIWCGGARLLTGMPPRSAGNPRGNWIVADREGDWFYVVSSNSVEVCRADSSLGRLCARPIASPPELTALGSPSWGRALAGYVFGFPQATRFGPDVVCYIQEGPRVYRGRFDGLLGGATARAADSGDATPPNRVVEGRRVQFAPFGRGATGEFAIVNGPKGAAINSNGVITWTPTAADAGPQSFKIRAVMKGETSFQRFSTEVVPAALAAKVGGDLGKIDSVGTHYLLESTTGLDVLADQSGLILLDGRTLRILDADGQVVTQTAECERDYVRVLSRTNHLVAAGAGRLDLIDRKTLRVRKSHEVTTGELTDLALHPSGGMAYVAARDRGAGSGNPIEARRVIRVDETTGKAGVLERVYGNWLAVDPSGTLLYTAIKESVQVGYQFDWWIGDVLPSYGDIDILVSYSLREGRVVHQAANTRPGENGACLRLSPDGAVVSYVSGGGYRSGPEGMNGYTIPAFDAGDIRKALAAYRVDAYPQDVSYHPKLDLVAGTNRKEVRIFARRSGELLDGKCNFNEARMTEVQRVLFSPGGRHLLVLAKNGEGRRVLQAFALTLTPAEIRQLAQPIRLVTPRTVAVENPALAGGAGMAHKLTAADWSALNKAGAVNLSARDISDRFASTVVVIKSDGGVGSGFFVSASGHILTCAHVLPQIGGVRVFHRPGGGGADAAPEQVAEIVGVDAQADLALLKIAPAGRTLPAVHMDRPGGLARGDEVSIIGNPGLGGRILDYTMTQGIVSTAVRELDGQTFVQTTAAVNPGSSGSPLFNNKGNVVGLVVLKGTIEGVGFAVPLDVIQKFLRRFLQEPPPGKPESQPGKPSASGAVPSR